ALRARQQRNFLTALLLSQGVPMICHGDEMGRTQQGNNTTYCQDNELSWVDWQLDDEREDLLTFTRRLIALRKEQPVLRRRRFFAGAPEHGGESEIGDIEWFTPDAGRMDEEDWDTWYARSIMMFLNGEAIPEPGERGERIVGDSVLALLNADAEPLDFTLPGADYGTAWHVALDTADEDPDEADERELSSGASVTVTGRSVVVLTRPPQDGE